MGQAGSVSAVKLLLSARITVIEIDPSFVGMTIFDGIKMLGRSYRNNKFILARQGNPSRVEN